MGRTTYVNGGLTERSVLMWGGLRPRIWNRDKSGSEERNEARMGSIAEKRIPETAAMPRFEDGAINLQELFRRLAEDVANGVMDAEADQVCEATGNSRNGYRERTLKTCVGDLALRVPKLRSGSFFPQDVITRYQRVDRALAATVQEMYATGTSARKVQRVAERMGASSEVCQDFGHYAAR